MARRTATDFVGEIRSSVGNPTEDDYPDVQILRICDAIQIDLAIKYEHPELFTSKTIATTNGTAAYTHSVTDCLIWEDLAYCETPFFIATQTVNLRKIREQGGFTTPIGQPRHWYRGATQITYIATPDATYSIVHPYKKKPAELVLSPTSAINSLDIGDAWDQFVVDKAKFKVKIELEKDTSAMKTKDLLVFDKWADEINERVTPHDRSKGTIISPLWNLLRR